MKQRPTPFRKNEDLNTEAAHVKMVNRTHRIVRDQALNMRARRTRSRELWAPLSICSTLLLVLCYAAWSMMDGYDLTPNGVPDASDQMLLLLIWSLPVTTVVLGLIWFRRHRGANGSGEQMP